MTAVYNATSGQRHAATEAADWLTRLQGSWLMHDRGLDVVTDRVLHFLRRELGLPYDRPITEAHLKNLQYVISIAQDIRLACQPCTPWISDGSSPGEGIKNTKIPDFEDTPE